MQPAGDNLVAVGGIRPNLDAFLPRECGTGTLLIRHPDCTEAAEYQHYFDAVWTVGSLAELARRCEKREWLKKFFADEPLANNEAKRVCEYVHLLKKPSTVETRWI